MKGVIIRGERRPDGKALTGQDVRVTIPSKDSPTGEMLVPALSLSLRVDSRHAMVIATIEVPAVLVDLEGVEVRTEAVVASGGPASQWEESIGKTPTDRIADIDDYSDTSAVVVGEVREHTTKVERPPMVPTDSMAELDRIIANGGKLP